MPVIVGDPQRVVAIVGPTAAGKSALALRLASELGGEIVSADSRQVYRHMDIGTGKPSREQRASIPHHLTDIVDPDEEYSLALFLGQASAALHEIHSRSKLAIVAGGTGQYLWGLLEGWQPPQARPDPALRRELDEKARVEGAATLFEELARLDPAAARRIDPQNTRRIVRALEVVRAAHGHPPERSRVAPSFQPLILGLTLGRATLYERIDERVDGMIEAGWVGEVERLLGRGFREDLPSLSSLGYRELGQHLKGELSLEAAVSKIKRKTRRLARQQYAWFRLDDERIRWFQGTAAGVDGAVAYVKETLGGGRPTRTLSS